MSSRTIDFYGRAIVNRNYGKVVTWENLKKQIMWALENYGAQRYNIGYEEGRASWEKAYQKGLKEGKKRERQRQQKILSQLIRIDILEKIWINEDI